MSTGTGTGTDAGSGLGFGAERLASASDRLGMRGLALGSAAVLVLSFTSVLYHIVDVVGQPLPFVGVVAASAVVATAFSRVVRARTAVAIGLVLLVGGLGGYLLTLPDDLIAVRAELLSDVFALLTGLSVLRLQNVDLWVLGFAPAPVFLTWHLAMRRRYVWTAVVGGAALGFFMLTGDVETPVALAGALGAAGAVGFGRLERYGADRTAAEAFAVVVAAMVMLTLTVSVVPGGSAQPFHLVGSDDEGTVEANLINTDDRVRILGSIELSPDVRFSVESNEGVYWRAAAYDRYTGGDWIRAGTKQPYDGRLSGPPGRARTVTQTYEFRSEFATMPAAWKPVRVSDNVAGNTLTSSRGDLQPRQPFAAGEEYTVTSRQPVATARELRTAGTDYPEEIEERYTQLPASTPDRVGQRTARITANAENPYDTARVIERWLENNREYSLDVDRPEGNIADSFLFEMEAGYCTYYATTMVTMLRSQGIPARFVVGYTPGERVAEDRWIVRGYNSHAWVEVYFPEVGWVRFDPTPAGPRESAEQQRLVDARESGESGVDTNATGGPEWTPTPTPTVEPLTPTGGGNGSIEDVAAPFRNQTTTARTPTGTNGTAAAGETLERGGSPLPDAPSREQVVFGLVVLVGLAAGARRSGATERAYRLVWLRWQPRSDPETDVERAFDRLEYLLGQRYRERRPGETARQYVGATVADVRADRVLELYERARYAGTVSESEADEAVSLVNEIVRKGVSSRPDRDEQASDPLGS